MKKKKNILLIVPDYPTLSGVSAHRIFWPHDLMGVKYSDNIDLALTREADSMSEEELSQFDLIVSNRFISKIGKGKELIKKLKNINVPYCLDLDDSYQLDPDHILYSMHREQKHAEQIIESIKGAAFITITQDYLANKIKKDLDYDNVYVVPNGLSGEGQFSPSIEIFDDVRFGWSGSITHFDSLLPLYDSLLPLYLSDDYKNKFSMSYGGYNNTDHTSKAIAGLLSAKGKASANQFRLYPTMDVHRYAEFYDGINVAFVALKSNEFNKCKSNLKLLEAGFKRKALIINDVDPYREYLRHGENCLVVKRKSDWYKHMKQLIDTPELIEYLSTNLYNDVKDRFSLDTVVDTRYNVYKKELDI